LSRYTPAQVAAVEAELTSGTRHPRDIKMELARETVGIYYGDSAAAPAEEQFKRVFQRGDRPDEMPQAHFSGAPSLVDFLAANQLARSKTQARHLIEQNGVRVDGQAVTDINAKLDFDSAVIQVGKRKFVRAMRQET